ncbi:MAG: flagellar assembly protein FliX [Alphaproteobacteria bacterium]|nr:flagellar assembly protein FliX [Alphaproteobacteria bacterium]
MKIEGPGKSAPSSNVKKTQKKSGDGGGFLEALSGTDESSGVTGASATHSIANIDLLLSAQSVEDPTEKAARQRMKLRAGLLLNELEKVRHGMLTGELTVGNMIDVADVVTSHREKIADPQLTAILDEIDLRAQIEIAKMKMALDAKEVRNG